MDVSDIFYFFCSGEGKGESGATWGGVGFLLKIPRGGGVSQEGVGGGEGAGRVSAGDLGNLGGGGAKYFFSGPKCPPREESAKKNKENRKTKNETNKKMIGGLGWHGKFQK